MSNMKIITVRFKDPILVGRTLEPVSSLSDGQQLEYVPIELEWYDNMFFKLTFPKSVRHSKYSQFIPWSNVGTAVLEEPTAEATYDAAPAVATSENDPLKAKRGRPRKLAE